MIFSSCGSNPLSASEMSCGKHKTDTYQLPGQPFPSAYASNQVNTAVLLSHFGIFSVRCNDGTQKGIEPVSPFVIDHD